MQEVIKILTETNKTISTMESCSGGILANSITNIPGASVVFKFGAVTYSNEYKIKLGVPEYIINKYTVYSMEVAKEMARIITEYANSDYGIGVTGHMKTIDPANPYGDNNLVYACIYDKDNDSYHPIEIVLKYDDRVDNKKQILDKIQEVLLEAISQ